MQSRLLLVCGALFLLVLSSSFCSPPEAQPQADESIPGIVFVGAPIFDEKTDVDGAYQGSHHWRDSYIYPRAATYHRGERTIGPPRTGRNLYSLIPARPDGKLTRLTHLKSGAVFKPEPSFDGKKVLFALRRDGEDWFHQYEINIDGTGLKQLTDGPFNDFGGVYLPDGRIVFCSDRTGYLEEYHEERTETLFVMHDDGTGIQQLTFLPGTYFEPSVMKDGRILFSFWDAFHIDVPPFDKHETYLMTVNPDGTEERHLFGAGQYRFFNRERHSGIGLTQAREMSDSRILVQSEMGPSLLDLKAGLSVRDALTPIFPGTTSGQIGGTTHRVHLSPLGTRSTAYPLQDGRMLFSATLPGARDSGIHVCNPNTREEQVLFNIPDYAEFDAVPVMVQRPKPAVLPARAKPDATTTRFLVIAGQVADNPERAEALKRAKYFRVVEAEYTGVTTSSHTNLETRILGTVPIFPDGSAYFEAPADTPLFLDPIDAGGNRVLMKWNYETTSVAVGTHYPATQMAYMSGRGGETKSCYGCHATQTDAVPNKPAMARKYEPVKVTREWTDLQYRRNDPEAYRRQARIGEAAKYRPWLASKDPMLRARACELMMFIEDGVEEDLPTIARLLKDEVVEVRRAAALALTRLATWKEYDALAEFAFKSKEQDGQVLFSVAVALELLDPILIKQDPIKEEDLKTFLENKHKEGFLPFETLARQKLSPAIQKHLRTELMKPLPDVLALRAAGKLKDAEAVPFLAPWLRKHEQEYHAAEAAVALGRIRTPSAVSALWEALRAEVPNRKVHISRYLQHGPRPEEYALLKGLILANAKTELKDVPLLIAMLPNTFTEKPRFEDRLRSESQRVLMPRLLLERAGLRQRAVAVLIAALRGEQKKDDPLHEQMLKGINLERPFSEHGRPFPVVEKIGPEEALWLLGCLLDPEPDLERVIRRIDLDGLVVPFLTSKNHRERIDAAVLLGLIGFDGKAADALAAEIAKPYSFPEIASIGKGMPDENFRDKAYMVQALARHIDDVNKLKPFADPKKMTRDIRYGLTHGLAFRASWDGIPLLIEMATRDPIALIRQQARYAIADVQDVCWSRGEPVPGFRRPDPEPWEAHYPPRGLTWGDTQFKDFDLKQAPPPKNIPTLTKHLDNCLAPGHFLNLRNSYIPRADRMMVSHVEDAQKAFLILKDEPGEAGRKPLLAALDKPYPFARAQAARMLGERGEREAIRPLLEKLAAYHQAQDIVGFWWCCEALAQLKAKEVIPTLVQFAVAENAPGTFGPPGMAPGYIAAKALAQIAADPKQADVAKLLASDNLWLRAGALRGLVEAKASGIEPLLQKAALPENPALVRYEAQIGLHRK